MRNTESQLSAIRRVRGPIALLVVALFANSMLAQVRRPTEAPLKIARTIDGHVYLGPDPVHPYERYCQLFDPQLQLHLGISRETVDKIQRFAHDHRDNWRQTLEGEKAGKIPPGTAGRLSRQYIEDASNMVEEILTPPQSEKLTQWLYRMESKRIGLGVALTEGRLAAAVGVYPNQTTGLADKARQIEEQLQLEIAELRAKAEQQLLAELAPEQREKATQLLGEDFQYENLTREQKLYRQRRAEMAEQQTQTGVTRSAQRSRTALPRVNHEVSSRSALTTRVSE